MESSPGASRMACFDPEEPIMMSSVRIYGAALKK
jgi:hypothetical protein